MIDTTIDPLLAVAARGRASDVHLTAGLPAQMRVDGSLEVVPGYHETLSAAWLESALAAIMSPSHRDEYRTKGEVDLSYQ
ncbi:MAG: type IV pili twitching motility protein PilT, partial [Microbacterium sp.]|nr:type IV pili twitching motility protein PilT [Microbacterium sp.]